MKGELDEYAARYRHVRMQRGADGLLELQLHSDGGPLVWGAGPHTELGHCFADVGGDRSNRAVLLTGTGDSFIAALDKSWVGEMTPLKWEEIYRNGKRLLQALLDVEVPMIAAVNGAATVHAELALLCDIVIASDDAVFRDAPHFRYGTVPGDGVHLIWPLLLGMNRGRHFLLTGRRIGAKEALELGLVAEVVPRAQLLERAREIARDLLRQPDIALRYTRQALTQVLKRALVSDLGYGLALEGLGAWDHWPRE
jgi:enoyl-CoA hydratase/carnithine racemase